MHRKSITIVVALVLFLLAAGLTVYPIISNYVNQTFASEVYTSYEAMIEQADDSRIQDARTAAIRYNAALVPGATEEAYSQEAVQAAAIGYENLLNVTGSGIMGYVEVPLISVNLPIFHGTDADSLERGIGHLLGSSLPVGGASTHTILTGHSGMATNKMFTDLEQLRIGDVFYLHILNETLAYQVSEINTVEPHETDLLSIVPGADLCTLVTCTPYGVNSHRLLVRGTRIPYEEAEAIIEAMPAEELPTSSWEQKYYEGIVYGLIGAICLSSIGLLLLNLWGKRYRGKYCGKRRRSHTPGYQGKYLQAEKAKPKHDILRTVILCILAALFAGGAAFAAYPYIHGYLVDQAITDTASDFLDSVSPPLLALPPEASALSVPEAAIQPPRDYQELWDDMTEYNRRIYAEKQAGLSTVYDYQKPSFLLERYGFDTEVFGVISIPAMELEMPIYLGATEQHMALGAAHMTQTSLPIGGENTNTVIAAHRGYNGASYFRYIDKLKVGDLVTVQNLWETLNYRVTSIQIIDPQDMDAILIQPGREMLTLLTCHPYASGGRQRYLVYCDRILE